MAVLAFSALGAGLGSLAPAGFTFLGLSGSAIGWAAGQAIGQAVMARRQHQVVQGPRITDTRFTSSAYGETIPIVFGTYPVGGKIIKSTPVREVQTSTTQRVGGKGIGGQKVTQQNYSYFCDLVILLGDCEHGPIAGVRKIKVNGEVKYDVSVAASGNAIAGSTLLASSIRIYTGTETQQADPFIVALEMAADPTIVEADVPAHLGYAYAVIENMDVTTYGGKPPAQWEFEIVGAGSAADLAVPTVHTLGASDGSSVVVLGRGGNIYAGPETSGSEANRWSFYSGVKLGSYVPPSFAYSPVGVTLDGEAIAVGSGGGATVLHEDGSKTAYTGGFAFMGSGFLSTFYAHGIVPESASVWWARGDSSASTTFFRITISGTVLTATQLTSVHCFQLARNAAAIAGRVYMHAASTLAGQKYVSYVDAGSSSLVLLVAQTTIGGVLVASSGHVWVGPADSVAERKTIRKYDSNGTLLLTVDVNNTEALTTGWSPFEDPSGFVWAVGIESGSNRRAYQIHPTTGQILARSELFLGLLLGFTEDNRAVIWDTVAGNFTLKEIERLPRLTVGTTTLSNVVQTIITRAEQGSAKLTAGDLALTALTDSVRGYAIGNRMSKRAALEPLLPVYRFDLVEVDDQIKAIKRTGTVALTVEEDDLGAHVYGSQRPEGMISKRLLETELPMQFAVQYPDVNLGYEPNVQESRRQVGSSRDPQLIESSLAMTETEAKNLAEVLLYDRWNSRVVDEISLPIKYARLHPGDVIRVPYQGLTRDLLIQTSSVADYVMRLGCMAFEATAYAPTGAGVAGPDPVTEPSFSGPTVLRLLDIPLLRDEDDTPGFYAAAAAYYSGWRGAELWRSIDGGASYERVDTAFTTAAAIGAATSVLANWTGGNVFDEANFVDINLLSDIELDASTSALVLAGANAAYLGGELIHWRDRTQLSARKWRLSGLLRGRRGTEQYIATHTIGELFVALSTDSARRISVPSSEIGLERLYKAPAFGQLISDAAVYPFTLAAVGLECLAPVHLAAGRTANASWDIAIKWVPRTRVGGEWRDYVDVPVGEATESYEVDIFDSTFTTLKRTLTGLSSPAATYTSAQQVTDFGSNQTTIYIDVYKLSATVGRGFRARATLTV